jgi:hypothetical protein
MLAQSNDEKVRTVRAKKRNDSIYFFGFDQVPGYLNGMSAPLGNRGLHESSVMSLPIRFEALRDIRSYGDDESGICGRWLNHGDGLEGCTKQLAEFDRGAECIASRWRVVIRNDDLSKSL